MTGLRVVLGSVDGSKNQTAEKINWAPPTTVVLVKTGVNVREWNQEVVFVEKWKREWQWNANGSDNNRGDDSQDEVVTRETYKTCVVGKPPVRNSVGGENALRVKVRAFKQLKWCRSQAAERKQDELPEHFNAGWTTEDAMKTVESTQPVREENYA